jgi:MFS family permease
VVAAVTFIMLLTTAGAMGLPGALILPLNAEFGWGTAAISSALALRIMLYGLMGPFAAALMNRYGLRNVAITSALLISLALAGASLMREFWQMIVLWGIVVGIATGLTALVFAATVANRWFVKRRGLLVGLLSASSATGQLAFLPRMWAGARRFCRRVSACFSRLSSRSFSLPTGLPMLGLTPMERKAPSPRRRPWAAMQ